MNTPTTNPYQRIADELRANPSHWTQGYYAKGAKGNHVSTSSPRATCWCAIGLCWRDGLTTDSLYAVGDFYDIASWNDNPERTVDDVIALFETAAKEAQ